MKEVGKEVDEEEEEEEEEEDEEENVTQHTHDSSLKKMIVRGWLVTCATMVAEMGPVITSVSCVVLYKYFHQLSARYSIRGYGRLESVCPRALRRTMGLVLLTAN